MRLKKILKEKLLLGKKGVMNRYGTKRIDDKMQNNSFNFYYKGKGNERAVGVFVESNTRCT